MNILLLGTVALSSVAVIIIFYSYFLSLIKGKSHHGDNPAVVFSFSIFFMLLLKLSKKGYYLFVSKLFVFLYLIAGVYLATMWGTNTPQALLIFSLTIILSGILVGRTFSYVITSIIFIFLMIMSHIHIKGLIVPDTAWKMTTPTVRDMIMYGSTLSIIYIVAAISHYEIERSFRKVNYSQKLLRKERDLLDIRVRQKIKLLKTEQVQRMEELNYFINFGKLASGLIHDLMTPLTMISLNLGELENSRIKKDELKKAITRSKKGISYIEGYIETARKQSKKHLDKKIFQVYPLIKDSLSLNNYNMKSRNISIETKVEKNIVIYGNPYRFSQVINNLILNAIESFDNTVRRKKLITISSLKNYTGITLSIKDNGKGIEKKNLKNIFVPFFSTKPQKGMGIGLNLCKDIVENEFNAILKVKSRIYRGTEFTIIFKSSTLIPP